MNPHNNHNIFYLAVLCCALGWFFLGLGLILFPLSLFLLTRSNFNQLLFVIFVSLDITGFTLSLFANAQLVTKHIF
ncbi:MULTISPECIES: hypothetical protein [Helicobacter]|uniref:Uncharacterized protein n=1 Tax=Helicobacter typhlonius TaxID=76936 RepID=A0A0S4PZL5_9HELI|nr:MULTISPECIES: hypothetical protein [Helicobacter]TLD78185.1 hypothetical protein LS75_006940 [Helicobacter typhlonius]TLD86838.1 hypothetical protein LS67_007280 [Helicobacter sp. MIT 03-1616]CUU40658.1 Hypothetical protein BN2458_PEG1775 [Helicobacter typhlonius]HCD72707.1 hypothetical protein [Helicobacter sp.]